jgi:hypothetical protein
MRSLEYPVPPRQTPGGVVKKGFSKTHPAIVDANRRCMKRERK